MVSDLTLRNSREPEVFDDLGHGVVLLLEGSLELESRSEGEGLPDGEGGEKDIVLHYVRRVLFEGCVVHGHRVVEKNVSGDLNVAHHPDAVCQNIQQTSFASA